MIALAELGHEGIERVDGGDVLGHPAEGRFGPVQRLGHQGEGAGIGASGHQIGVFRAQALLRDLVAWLAKDTPGWSRDTIEAVIASGERIDVELTEPVPVYFTYITAWSTHSGIVHFRDDIYRRDGVDELALR